tara:strand:+ start:3270 stop:3404 length:135 start_codon:yes stop_codon:yes gene_type:complete
MNTPKKEDRRKTAGNASVRFAIIGFLATLMVLVVMAVYWLSIRM